MTDVTIAKMVGALSPEKRRRLAAALSEPEPIAVIGIGCRFGNAASPLEFWQLLRSGVDAVVDTPTTRWDADAFYHPDPDQPGRMNTRRGSFLPEVDRFDAGFFGMSRRETEQVDPQQRGLLEVAADALEDAGLPLEAVAGSMTGVFVGLCESDYTQNHRFDPRQIDVYSGTGTSNNAAAGRISYALDLHGPSLVVDTACSSSLVATHLACQSLEHHECDLALAGGAKLLLSPFLPLKLSKLGLMSATGQCRPFDSAADGIVLGEGFGVIALRRLGDAQASGDAIYAVIRGSAVNQDGASAGLTAPNGRAQHEVIVRALERARRTPDQVTFVEAHGTGTQLGDPIEYEALEETYGEASARKDQCCVGSVKANIGHAEAAAGIAGLIKVALAIEHREIPPQIHYREPNPAIRSTGSLHVSTYAQAWDAPEDRRAGAVSSFGWSGTNAHVILESSP